MKRRNMPIAPEPQGRNSLLDYRKSQFRDLLEFVSPSELHEPIRGNLYELDVNVQSLRNVTFGY